jgi:hypothetical protein
MLKINGTDKMVGKSITLYNPKGVIPSDWNWWVCDRVIEYPGQFDSAYPMEEAYRFEFSSTDKENDLPLCIYLYREEREGGRYLMQNNLMDGDWFSTKGEMSDMGVFTSALTMYSTKVIIDWLVDNGTIENPY